MIVLHWVFWWRSKWIFCCLCPEIPFCWIFFSISVLLFVHNFSVCLYKCYLYIVPAISSVVPASYALHNFFISTTISTASFKTARKITRIGFCRMPVLWRALSSARGNNSNHDITVRWWWYYGPMVVILVRELAVNC